MRAVVQIIVAASTLIAVCVLFLLVYYGCVMTNGRTNEVPPFDRRTSYLLFPRENEDVVKRAIIVSGEELAGTSDFSFYDGDTEKSIAREILSLYPPAEQDRLFHYISALNTEISRWGAETDLSRVEYQISGTKATLTEFLKNGRINYYIYNISADYAPTGVTVRYGL